MQIAPATPSVPEPASLDRSSGEARGAAWRDRRFFNLPQHRTPVVNASYQARSVSRPGTVAEWASLVDRLASLAEQLYRDARTMTGKRREMLDHRPGTPAHRDAERISMEMHKRAVRHCQDLAHALLSTGLPREHIDGHLARCGTEHGRPPEYGIAVLYSKLMGIPFREERLVPVFGNTEGDAQPRVVIEERAVQWTQVIEPRDLDDFYWTMRTLQEQLPILGTKFHRTLSRSAGMLSAYAA